MCPSADLPPDDGMHERARPELAALSLDENVPGEVHAHVDSCPACRDEVAAYRAVAALARGTRAGEPDPDLPPPPRTVWDGIVAELAADDAAPERADGDRRRPRTRAKIVAAVAAGVVVLAGVGIGGWAVGRASDDGRSDHTASTARAALAAQPGTRAGARGDAIMTTSPDGARMNVSTHGLPAPSGYYEVWLYDPTSTRMVAIGTLGAGATGSFTVPAGLDTGAYHVVDVSNQRLDGNAAHQRSVLRGPLVRK